MLSRNANLSTAELLARLREGAQPFPASVADDPTIQSCHVPVDNQDVQLAQCLCTTSTCGAGMANAAASLEAADRPIAAVQLPASVAAGQNVTLQASGSAAACGRTVASYLWTVVAPLVNPPAIAGADTAVATVIAPSSGTVTLRLTVTDNLNRTDIAEVSVEPSRATSTAPSSAGNTPCAAPVISGPTPDGSVPPPVPAPATMPPSRGGGGGGGSLGLTTLCLLGVLCLGRSLRRHKPHFLRCN
jgi:serine protease